VDVQTVSQGMAEAITKLDALLATEAVAH